MKRSLFLAGIVLSATGYSQSTDSLRPARLITASPKLGGINISHSFAPVNENGHAFSIQAPVLDIGIPVYKKFSSRHPVFIRTGIRYQGLFLSGDAGTGSKAFHSITIPLLASYSINRGMGLTFIGMASIASDFKKPVTVSDVQYTIGARWGFQKTKTFRWGVTLTYTTNYSGSFLLPLPDVEWEINKRWNLTAIVPARMSLKYLLSKERSVGITSGLAGNTYRLNAGNTQQYIHLQQNNAGMVYEQQFNQRWKVNLIAGYTFSQRLETFNMDQKVSLNAFGKLNNRSSNLSYRANSFILQAAVSYQF